jgi:hypothetical protein
MNAMGYSIKMTVDGMYKVIDNSDNSFAEFNTLHEAMDFAAHTFLIPEEELDLAMVEMVKNNHSVAEFGGLRGSFLYSA